MKSDKAVIKEASVDKPNGDPLDGFFYPTLTRIMDLFSCSSLVLFIYLF